MFEFEIYLSYSMKNLTKARRKKSTSADPNALVLHDSVLALDPAVLHQQAEDSVRTLLAEGESANTMRSYASALRYWAAWFRLRYRVPITLPVPVPAVLQFLVDHVEHTAPDGQLVHDLPVAIDEALVAGGFKGALGSPALNTVLHRCSVLSKAHQTRELGSPTRDPLVQELVRRIRRAYAQRGDVPAAKTALTKGPLEAMLATCTDGLIGLRDAALLSFAFSSGGRRRSEVARADMAQLVKLDPDTYVFRLVHAKNQQSGAAQNPDADKPIVGPAAHALTAWLEAAAIQSGPIFRRIRGTVVTDEALSGQAVWLIVKRRAPLAGLNGDYGAHSLRSGFVSEAGRQNVHMKEAMILTGHRSVQTFLRYFQPGALSQTRAAHLLSEPQNDGQPPPAESSHETP
jgi:integrase